jgi:hypothetical protein
MPQHAPVKANEWYETIRKADDVTLIHEPWIKPFSAATCGTSGAATVIVTY